MLAEERRLLAAIYPAVVIETLPVRVAFPASFT